MATENKVTEPKPIEIFYSYAHKDEKLRNELNSHLYNLKRQGLIADWYDRDISAGTEWKHEIDVHLNTTQVILLLISPDFMASEYCYSIEMTRAMERHEAGEARVVPIILKPVDWQDAPFCKLQMLPKNAKALTSQRNRSEAFVEIAKSIRETVKKLKPIDAPKPEPPSLLDLTRPISTYDEQPQSIDLPPVWYVPYERNPFFTARADVLDDLDATFINANTVRVLSGLGGMGKTQTAIEYAYRHRDHYHIVLWARAETQETLFTDFVHFAYLLQLPGRQEQDQKYTVSAVKYWLATHKDWLLILDNVEDLNVARDHFPANPRGHVLMTTRTQVAGGIAPRLEIEKMEPEEGALLLMRRANLMSPHIALADISQADSANAIAISKLLDGLPLALDQAAAYIEETGISLPGYVDLYDKRRAKLLNKRGGLMLLSHPEPVSTTWSLSFERVEQASPAAADLLRFFAFLHPDAIPEELVSKGTSHFGPLLQTLADDPYEMNEAIAELRKYSLIRRNPDGPTFSLHRLVQAVLIDVMDEQTQQEWSERIVRTINDAFPSVEFKVWADCQRYLPHAQYCFDLIKRWNMIFPEAARLLNEAGQFLVANGQYTEAAPLLELALAIREQVRGPEHLEVAESLNNLAELYRHQGKYYDIEALYKRALDIREQILGPMHPDVATSLNNMARPYHHLMQFDKAIPLYKRALDIREQVLGSMHYDVADTLNDLGLLYREKGQDMEAKPLLERALAIREQALGPMHPDTANSLSQMGSFYGEQGQDMEAKPLLERALAIREQVLGPMHPDTASGLSHLGSFYRKQGQYIEAKSLCERELAISEQVLGPMHPETAVSLNNLGILYQDQGQYIKAKPLYERALAIREQVLGPMHPNTATSLNNLGILYGKQGRDVKAKSLIERGLAICEQVLGPMHPDTAISLNNLGMLYLAQRNYTRAEPFFQRALTIAEKMLGPEHPTTVEYLTNYANLLHAAKRNTKAEEMEARIKAAEAKRAQEDQDQGEVGE